MDLSAVDFTLKDDIIIIKSLDISLQFLKQHCNSIM